MLSSSTSKVREESKASKADFTPMIQDNESAEAEEIEEANVLNEIIIGKGIGNALKVMRSRGMLGKT